MFSLFVVSFAYVCYFTYIKCFKTKSLSFEDKNIRAFDFIKMDIFTDMDVLTVYSPYREIEDDVKYIIIEYEYDDKIMKYVRTARSGGRPNPYLFLGSLRLTYDQWGYSYPEFRCTLVFHNVGHKQNACASDMACLRQLGVLILGLAGDT